MPNLTNYHQGLNYLLDLNGETFVLGNGYWSLIEARTVPPTANTLRQRQWNPLRQKPL